MMRFWRFAPLLALTGAILMLAAAVAVVVYTEQSYREQKTQETVVEARTLARVMAAPLAFDDDATASIYLSALSENPNVVAVAVYGFDGTVFASYRQDGAAPFPEAVEPGSVIYGNGQVSAAVAVEQQGMRLGTVYTRTITESFAQRVARYTGVVLTAIMMLIVLAVLGVAQATVNRANQELNRRADSLQQANARLREQIEQREKAEEALRQAQKMESIGHLTGGVAHDFNNLLAIILGNLERLGRRIAQGGEREELERALANARLGAERAAGLTRSLLAFARRQPLKPQTVDVNRLVSGMSELLRRTLGEQITIESVVAGGLWRTLVDPNQLENAILNLAVNARDAMPTGGKLTIETANAYLDARYTSDYDDLEPGQYVVLSITDTGSGMTPEAIERAFEPFFTTKEIGHGTGLGLSQVYGLVKQSGGHIKIYSEVGEGTTIRIYLPRHTAMEEPAAAPVPLEALVADGTSGGRAEPVLVVEDNDDMRDHSCAALAELGYRVFDARDGAQALGVLDDHPEIVLLFTDVGLPGGMNGRQLAEEALRRRPGLKVLYTTGYARNAIVHDGRLDPSVELVTKPFTFEELAGAVRKVLASGPPQVLVVEDEFLVRMTLVDDLSELGCTTLEAGTVAEARVALKQHGATLAAVIVDLSLPDHKGDGFVAEMRAQWPALPVIVSSGAGAEGLRPDLVANPMVGILPKPFDSAQLKAVLRAAGIAAGIADAGRT